ncbi:MAG TPA: nucleoid occlusion factor SlmA, partial [Burkholderiaceae bacterium]|nr:nucleoid occlusion factor SlmA [Burkholderiaceae bacterium]
ALRQALKIAQAGGTWTGDPISEANALLAFVLGRWMLFAKSGFKRMPQEHWETQRKYLLG